MPHTLLQGLCNLIFDIRSVFTPIQFVVISDSKVVYTACLCQNRVVRNYIIEQLIFLWKTMQKILPIFSDDLLDFSHTLKSCSSTSNFLQFSRTQLLSAHMIVNQNFEILNKSLYS